ncbi:MAG TPA: AMP-binding protein [Solirubrobacteraceae bacterium]|jgi:long-subunit acyl-CoA synthetase (AMP-forming)|nr:AMP-binding protein [Solirubrobacteraceae bacterium]
METMTGSEPQSALQAQDLCEAFARTVASRGSEPALRSSDGAASLTWAQFDGQMRAVAGGLTGLGVGTGGTVVMLLTNRYEAAMVDMATLHVGAVPVSLYNSSAVEQLTYLFDDARADVVVSERAFADKVREAIASGTRKPKLVLVDGEGGDEADVTSVTALQSLGAPLPVDARPSLTPKDILTVVYTSGTTGTPKGAELTHESILVQIRGLHELGRLPEGGRALSYLPFAHMGDRLCAYYMPVVMGSTITYHNNPRTASDLLPDVRPTLYMAVPRIWQKLQWAAGAHIAQSPERDALQEAVQLGSELHDDRVEGREQDAGKVERWRAHEGALNGLRAALGLDAGELLFTGAAPLPPETLRFFAAIGIDLCECYGQSETAGIVLCNPAGNARPNTNGLPLPNVEVKLAQDGELLLKAPQVMAGYRGKPELTAQAFDEDGWLITGDIFVIDEAGYYRIVDRKKEIIINAAGKNMAPVHIENTISAACPLVGSVATIGDARSYNTALIALEPEGTAALTGQADPAVNARDAKVIDAIRAGVRAGNERLNRAEQIKRFTIVPSTWLPGTDELTPTMKLRRRVIDQKYKSQIDALYIGSSPEVIEVE